MFSDYTHAKARKARERQKLLVETRDWKETSNQHDDRLFSKQCFPVVRHQQTSNGKQDGIEAMEWKRFRVSLPPWFQLKMTAACMAYVNAGRA